jgi:Zn-dependent protease
MPAFDLTLSTVLVRIVVLLPILAVAGLVAALAARLLGDEGPAQDGRMTANPFVHLDMLGALGFVVTGLGWGRPVALSPEGLRGGRVAVLAVIAAPVIALLLLAWAAVLVLPFAARITTGAGVSMLGTGFAALVRTATGFALFNLLPVLPLIGGYLLDAVAPAPARWLRDKPVVPALVLLALLFSGLPTRMLSGPVTALLAFVSGGAGSLVGSY